MPEHDADARRALARFQRALEKARRELGALREAAERADPMDVPTEEYQNAEGLLDGLMDLAGTEGARFQQRILRDAGLDAGRLRGAGPS